MNTALLVVDAQKIYTSEDSEMYCEDASNTISNINAIIKHMQKDSTIIYIRHIHKKDGTDIGLLFDFDGEGDGDFNFKEGSSEVEYDENLYLLDNKIEIIKNRYSAFEGTSLQDMLKNKKIQKVVICGFMTNFCCESTARTALDRDFYVDFILDATGTPGTENYDQEAVRNTVGELLAAGFARVFSTSDFLEA